MKRMQTKKSFSPPKLQLGRFFWVELHLYPTVLLVGRTRSGEVRTVREEKKRGERADQTSEPPKKVQVDGA